MKTFKTRTVYFVFSEDFRLCSRFNNVIYGAWHVNKAWFGSSVTSCRLACSEISLSIIEKKLERSPGKDRTLYNLADGLRALAQIYALYSHRERSFNQWQRASYPNFCYNRNKKCLNSVQTEETINIDWMYTMHIIQALRVIFQ